MNTNLKIACSFLGLTIIFSNSCALDVQMIGPVGPYISYNSFFLGDSIIAFHSNANSVKILDSLSEQIRIININPNPEISKDVVVVKQFSIDTYNIFANRQRNNFCWPYIYWFNLNDTGFVEERFYEINLPWRYYLADAKPIINGDYMTLCKLRNGDPSDWIATRVTPEGDTLWTTTVMTTPVRLEYKTMEGITANINDAGLFYYFGLRYNLNIDWNCWMCVTQIDTSGEVQWYREYAWGRPGYLMGVDITGLHAFDDGTYGIIGTWDINVGYLHIASNGDSLGSYSYQRGTISGAERTYSLLLSNQNLLVMAVCDFPEIRGYLGLYYINEQGDSLGGYFFNPDTMDNTHGPMFEHPDGRVMLWVIGKAWDRNRNPYISPYLFYCYPDGRPGEVAPYETPDQPACFLLHPAYPNPFNSTAVISFNLPAASPVSIKAFDLAGREVKTLTQGFLSAGEHRLVWNAGGIGAGSYLLRLETPIQTNIQKVNIVK